MFGVWMWPESLLSQGADAALARCARAGVTDVFLLCKGLSGKSAFLSPLTQPIEPGRDLLGEALCGAHDRGMRIHAWFTSASDALYRRAHPESGLYHIFKGRYRDIVSITDQGYTDYMRAVIADMAKRYPVDGVHLDYIRYNHLCYGWSEDDLSRYAQHGVDTAKVTALMKRTFDGPQPDSEAIFDAWRAADPDVRALSQVRRASVTAFARALSEAARDARPGLTVSCALMPEGAYDDLAFSDLHYGQNYADLSAVMDLFVPMAYRAAYGKDAAWVADVARGTAKHGVPALIGVHAYEGATGLTLREDIDAVQGLSGVLGACLFREGSAAWVFSAGRRATVYDPLAAPLTALSVIAGDREERIAADIPAGAERDIELPFEPEAVRAFTADGEVCAYLKTGA